MNEDLRLHGLLGGGGNNIKSIQRGVVKFGNTQGTATISVNSVIPGNTIILLNVSGYSSVIRGLAMTAKLTNATTLVIQRDISNASQGLSDAYWTIIEFKKVKSKQTGTFTNSLPTNFVIVNRDITISTVDALKTVVIVTTRTNDNVNFEVTFCRGQLTSSTNLRLTCYSSNGGTLYHEWQVIEFD